MPPILSVRICIAINPGIASRTMLSLFLLYLISNQTVLFHLLIHISHQSINALVRSTPYLYCTPDIPRTSVQVLTALQPSNARRSRQEPSLLKLKRLSHQPRRLLHEFLEIRTLHMCIQSRCVAVSTRPSVRNIVQTQG